jgi:hypothetical protein
LALTFLLLVVGAAQMRQQEPLEQIAVLFFLVEPVVLAATVLLVVMLLGKQVATRGFHQVEAVALVFLLPMQHLLVEHLVCKLVSPMFLPLLLLGRPQ